MKAANLIKALEKAGAKVDVSEHQKVAIGPKNNVTFFIQGDEAVCVCCNRNGDKPDSMTDYFPGFFTDKIKRAADWVGQPVKGAQ